MPHNLSERLVRNKLAKYLSGEISLQGFNRWFVPATWDVDDASSKSLRDLIGKIKLRLAEYSSGHWEKDELDRELTVILGFYAPNQQDDPSGSSSKTITVSNRSPSPVQLIEVLETRSLLVPS